MSSGGGNNGATNIAWANYWQDVERNHRAREDAAAKAQGSAMKANTMKDREVIAEQIEEQSSKRPDRVEVELASNDNLDREEDGTTKPRRSKFAFQSQKNQTNVRT